MPRKPNPSLDDENPEWTAEDFAQAKPTRDFYAEQGLRYPGQRGAQKAPTKAQVTLRLDREVVEGLRASGPGWQTRANEILRRSILRSTNRRVTAKKTRVRRASRHA